MRKAQAQAQVAVEPGARAAAREPAQALAGLALVEQVLVEQVLAWVAAEPARQVVPQARAAARVRQGPVRAAVVPAMRAVPGSVAAVQRMLVARVVIAARRLGAEKAARAATALAAAMRPVSRPLATAANGASATERVSAVVRRGNGDRAMRPASVATATGAVERHGPRAAVPQPD